MKGKMFQSKQTPLKKVFIQYVIKWVNEDIIADTTKNYICKLEVSVTVECLKELMVDHFNNEMTYMRNVLVLKILFFC